MENFNHSALQNILSKFKKENCIVILVQSDPIEYQFKESIYETVYSLSDQRDLMNCLFDRAELSLTDNF
jgi:hypothetical protein